MRKKRVMLKQIRTVFDLEEMRERILKKRESQKIVLRTCKTGCRARKSQKVVDALENAIQEQGVQNTVKIKKTGCHGFCEMGPIIVVEPENIFYRKVKPEDAHEIVSRLTEGGVVERLLWKDPVTKEQITLERDLPTYKRTEKRRSPIGVAKSILQTLKTILQ
jgi:NADH-quinone oxidoreductase subunit F